jgi:hypothetical protein
MDGKHPVVMISSTVSDLRDHRQRVKDACIKQNMFPKMMEHMGAVTTDGLRESMRLVDEADIYLGIVGHRYGSVPKGKTKSITHYEYERAKERGIPCFIFAMHDDHPVKVADVEMGEGSEKLRKFKDRLLKEHSINFFKSPDELLGLVVNTLANYRADLVGAAPDRSVAEPNDPVVLTAILAVNQSVELVQKIGCPCLELTIHCRSKRPAKVAGAALHVRGLHVLAAFQDAFSTKFGWEGGDSDFLDQPSYYAGFLPGSKPDTPNGFVIEQDDVRKFLLPSHRPHLLYFIEAPPDSVSLEITHIDGRSETLLRGVEVQEVIPTLVRMCLDMTYNLHPAVVLPCGIAGRMPQMPDYPTPGLLNEKPLGLPPHPDRDKKVDEASDYIGIRAKILRACAEKDLASEEWLLDTLRATPDREIRRDAIVALRRLATPRARALFTELLVTETNEITRELIIRSFALVGTAADIPRMESLAQAESSQICRKAAVIAYHFIRHRDEKPSEETDEQNAPEEGQTGERY